MRIGVFILKKMLLVDLETQNYPVDSGIYEVACLVVEDYEIIDQLYLGREIEGYPGDRKWGFGFHNISRDDAYIKQFNDFILKYPYPIVAHNCSFDKKFLVYYEWVEKDYPFYCSIRAIRNEVPSLESYALGKLIPHFGLAETTQHRAFDDVMDLYELLSLVRPQKWVALGVKDYSKRGSKKNVPEIDLSISTTDILAEEKICFTGKSNYPRRTMQEIAVKNGAQISNTVTSSTTLLVVGSNAGSKLEKALANSISIISDEEFMEMLGLPGLDGDTA